MADVSIKIKVEEEESDDELDDIPINQRLKVLAGLSKIESSCNADREKPKSVLSPEPISVFVKEEINDPLQTTTGEAAALSGELDVIIALPVQKAVKDRREANAVCILYLVSLLSNNVTAWFYFTRRKSGKQSHLAELQKSNIRKDPHGTATSLFCTTPNFDSSSSNITEVSYTNHAHEGCESQESLSHFPGTQKSVSSFGNIKAETLDSDSEIHHANGMKSLVKSRKNVFVKSKIGTCEESDEHVIDHMILRQRKELLLSGRNNFNIDCSKNLKCLRKTLPSAFEASSDIPQPDKPEPVIRQKRKRKRTATDSVETALEEDAPGLLKVLFDRGILLDEIKLYGVGVDGDDLLDISSEDDSFGDLENVVSKLFSQRSPILKLAPLTKRNASKTYYCLACLLSLVEQTRYLIFRNWPVEWGWCRDLQSFIFVFERHNRIVLERPRVWVCNIFL